MKGSQIITDFLGSLVVSPIRNAVNHVVGKYLKVVYCNVFEIFQLIIVIMYCNYVSNYLMQLSIEIIYYNNLLQLFIAIIYCN